MSTPIKPGDLVMVVKPRICCGNSDAIGHIGTIAPTPWNIQFVHCGECGITYDEKDEFVRLSGGAPIHVSRLKKIDPPALADETETTRELETV